VRMGDVEVGALPTGPHPSPSSTPPRPSGPNRGALLAPPLLLPLLQLPGGRGKVRSGVVTELIPAGDAGGPPPPPPSLPLLAAAAVAAVASHSNVSPNASVMASRDNAVRPRMR
jgi:hypothetical protein